MNHMLKLSQDLEDMLRMDASEEDLRNDPNAKRAAKEVKKIQKRIAQLDEVINHKKNTDKTQAIILWALIGIIILWCIICGNVPVFK